ncbi:MAG: hypothetical protein JOY78_20475 [Pseudonocardia sp.]|nr:hypothetical protein [Pseudonocardia sp.]
MRRLHRDALVSLVAGLAAAGLGALPAGAQAPPPNPEINVFEVEAHTLYCVHGGSACVQHSSGISKLRFADATVFRFSPLGRHEANPFGSNSAVGKPELVHAVCATHYLDANGHVHARAIDVTGASLSIPGIPQARIEGKAAVVNGAESSRQAIGAVRVDATLANGDEAEIVGIQSANNTDDSRVWGGFRITVTGTVMDTDFQTNQSTTVGPGRMTCSTDVTPVTAPFPGPAPNTFSSEVNDTGDPS